MARAAVQRTTYAEYIAQCDASDVKLEWLQGDILAMSGGTPLHGYVASNLLGEIRSRLPAGCAAVGSDVRVYIEDADVGTFPDVMVVCGAPERHPDDRYAIINPKVVFEVLSPSTEGYDRGAKFRYYEALPSLQEYVLVSQEPEVIESFRRNPDGTWTRTLFHPGDDLVLSSCDTRVPVDAIYAGADAWREPKSEAP